MPQIIIKRRKLQAEQPQEAEKVLIVITDDQVEVYTGQEAEDQTNQE